MSKGHGERLSRKQEQAIVALLGQPTVGQAAQAVGVNEKTLRTWLKRPGFQAAYRDARREIVEKAITCLQQLCGGAVLALNRNLTCGTPSVEVRSAQAMFSRSCHAWTSATCWTVSKPWSLGFPGLQPTPGGL